MAMQGKSTKFEINEVIERYRWWIGSVLLALIILSGGYLMLKQAGGNDETKMTPSSRAPLGNDEQMLQLEDRIQKSESRIQQLESKSTEVSGTASPPASSVASDGGTVAGASTSSSSKASTPAGKISLNSATATQLDTLPGIGASYAQRIIDYRTSHGGFKDISELKNIKGIGDKTYDKLKGLVTI